MKFLVIGAGGIGGLLSAKLLAAHQDVNLIAHGKNLEALSQDGLTFISPDNTTSYEVKVSDMALYEGEPDVIFICVKSFSIDEVCDFIKAKQFTKAVIIPILNGFGISHSIQEKLGEEFTVLRGLIYASSTLIRPGVILQDSDLCRIIAGKDDVMDDEELLGLLKEIQPVLNGAGIDFEISKHTKLDSFKKFAFISPLAALSSYYGMDVAAIQVPGEQREMFVDLSKEVLAIGEKMGLDVSERRVQVNLDLLDELAPTSIPSMSRDLAQHKQSEIDSLIFEVIRLGKKYNVPTPLYNRVAHKYNFQS